MLGVDFLRKLRNKLTAFNAVKVEFNVLHDKLKSIEDLQSTINELQNKINVPDSCGQTTQKVSSFGLKAMDRNQSIRITFIFQYSSIWPVWHSIWEACMADSRVIVDVVLTPFIHPYASGAVTYDELR